jgi:mRNA-degrading endonuclease YafQ of YafQ-DinJ toxin-antitoxin module
MNIELSSHFIKFANKLSQSEKKLLSDRVDLLRIDPNNPKLKTHALTGKLSGLFAFSLNYSKRVVFTFVKKNTILLLDVGSHGEVYKK